MGSTNGSNIGLSIPAMTALMVATETRHLFSASGGIKYLARQLRSAGRGATVSATGSDQMTSSTTVQQLYELTFCLWRMTYELNASPNIRADFAKDGAAVSALAEMVSSAPREKVVRVALSALVNLATCSAEELSQSTMSPKIDRGFFLTEMLACRLLKSIEYLG